MAFTTRATLLEKIRAGDEIGWTEFHRMYRPLVLLRGRDRGVRDSELPELVQNVLVSLFKGQKRFCYDPARGRFRDFLRKIIDRRSFDLIRARRDEERDLGSLKQGGAILSSGDYEKVEAKWEAAWRKHLLRQAMERVRCEVQPKTYQAFEMCAIDDVDPAVVADTLHISVTSVYVAKHRVVKRLRPILAALEQDT